ncbi:MAG: NAD(P)(+) transhydrogenase (Re/Si-specific) subunit beta [Thermoguttaceae bacterium]
MSGENQAPVLQVLYLAACILFILGLKGLSSPKSARQGMNLAALGMLLAVVGTLFHAHLNFQWIIAGFIIGSLIGGAMAVFMPMTAMPQRIALSHAFGAFAAVLVGIVEFHREGGAFNNLMMGAIGFEILFGSLTITGSLMAFAKLQELVSGPPILYPHQNVSNVALFSGTLAIFVILIFFPHHGVTPFLFYVMIVLGLAIGVLMVMPIGGADMPVVVSLLNSYAGLSAAATGFVIGNNVLIVAGALDGASGFFLSVLMSRAMNRSFANVLFGAVGAVRKTEAATEVKTVLRYTPDDAAYSLESANSVIIIPGYGMAVAQAQHVLHEVAELLIQRGVNVRYAIHPVAGRMPGHMNVLLAEADVPYNLLCEMDEINNDFPNTDVALVVGANDTVNPAARYKKESPLYGMPILEADKARAVIVLKRSLKPGFAGEDNELFYNPKTMMVFGDAKATLTALAKLLKRSAPNGA